MEGKEKIILKDGTVYLIENGASENQVQVVLQNVDEFPRVFNKFTEQNLESYQIKNAEGLTCSTRKNKYLANAVVEQRESDVFVTFRLADVNMVEKRLDAIEAEQETTKNGQAIQDGAIADLGEIVAGMMEGGEA